ncbi:MAG: hypothetical protein OXC98_12145 [bacterium]|nr:hypothetical protein [Acidimicrobiia bacterium]MCY4651104.1 hypothetical protein [bacterium]
MRQICGRCGADVGDADFCSSCGALLERVSSPRSEPESSDADSSTSYEPTQNLVACSLCGHLNPPSRQSCEQCHIRLSHSDMPLAPRPAIRTNARVRAVIATGTTILAVAVFALLFNLFTGGSEDGEDTSDTTEAAQETTSTTAPPPIPTSQGVLSVQCSPEGLGANYSCDNLINGKTGEWQIRWTDITPGTQVTIKMVFEQPITVRRLEWVNLTDDTRFYQNFRVRTMEAGSDSGVAVPLNLVDRPGSQIVDLAIMRTNQLTLTITTVYDAEVRNGTVYKEMAVQGVNIIGYPAAPLSGETTTTTAAAS